MNKFEYSKYVFFCRKYGYIVEKGLLLRFWIYWYIGGLYRSIRDLNGWWLDYG